MFKRNKKKKIVIIVLSVILTLSVICLLYWRMDMQQRRKIYDDMKMEFNIPETIEYGSEIQAKDLIQSHEGGTLTNLPELDTKKKGEQKLLFRMTKNGIEREFSCTVTVKDTQPPEIVLKEETVTIESGSAFDPADNIQSVSDPVDGSLPLLTDDSKEKAGYTIEHKIDTDTPGTYTVTIQAKDSSDNKSSAEYQVIVNRQPSKDSSSSSDKTTASSGSSSSTIQPTYIKGILLVNKQYALPRSYGGTDQTAYNALIKLQDAASRAGYSMPLLSGYRSYDYQAQLYENYVARDGQAAADRYSARPGHSEHQSGLAFDVGDIDYDFGKTARGKWLAAHCAEFGFILRYPQGKESITGYMYEPWHIRYVGINAAKTIMNNSLTLEEYLGVA